jgi:hypothetical protein
MCLPDEMSLITVTNGPPLQLTVYATRVCDGESFNCQIIVVSVNRLDSTESKIREAMGPEETMNAHLSCNRRQGGWARIYIRGSPTCTQQIPSAGC